MYACPICGNKISPDAPICMNCGKPDPGQAGCSGCFTTIFALAFLFAMFWFCGGCIVGNKKTADTPAATATP